MKNILILIVPLLLCLIVNYDLKAQSEVYKNPSLSIEQRVDDIVSRMTLDEKISQMMNLASPIPGLGILFYNRWNEGLHGVACTGVATVFPQTKGLTATFNDSQLFNIATVILDELRTKYNAHGKDTLIDGFLGLTIWFPNLNIFRDPHVDNGQETYGEDPFPTSRICMAFVKGMQGNVPD
jgi:beta-glucosidase